MHPLVKGAIGVAVLAALGRPTPAFKPIVFPKAAGGAPPVQSQVPDEPFRCPARSLPIAQADGQTACLGLPEPGAQDDARMRRLAALPPSPAYLKMTAPTEQVPRLPERSQHYGDYQLPVSPMHGVSFEIEPMAPGERPKLGVRMATDPGAPVTLVDLEHQTGDRPEVVLVGQLYGVTVVVKHRVDSDEGTREYLVFYGNLDRPGPSITNGARLSPLAVVGFVGGEEDEDGVLYFEVRQQRRALKGPARHLTQLVNKSIAVDPRNVLPLVPSPQP